MSTIFERLLRGEITVEEYVADVKRRVHDQRREYKRGPGPSTGSQTERSEVRNPESPSGAAA